jgi:hypothetical protein
VALAGGVESRVMRRAVRKWRVAASRERGFREPQQGRKKGVVAPSGKGRKKKYRILLYILNLTSPKPLSTLLGHRDRG